eukprot:scaffold124831_cov14-Prasinocladus_malaysianus.AAC.1
MAMSMSLQCQCQCHAMQCNAMPMSMRMSMQNSPRTPATSMLPFSRVFVVGMRSSLHVVHASVTCWLCLFRIDHDMVSLHAYACFGVIRARLHGRAASTGAPRSTFARVHGVVDRVELNMFVPFLSGGS